MEGRGTERPYNPTPGNFMGQVVVNDHRLLVGGGFVFGSRFQQKLRMKIELEIVPQSIQDKVALRSIGMMLSQLPGKLIHLEATRKQQQWENSVGKGLKSLPQRQYATDLSQKLVRFYLFIYLFIYAFVQNMQYQLATGLGALN